MARTRIRRLALLVMGAALAGPPRAGAELLISEYYTPPNSSSVSAIKAFDVASGAYLYDFLVGFGGGQLVEGPDDDLYANWGDQVIRLDGLSGTPLGTFLDLDFAQGPTRIAFAPNGELIVGSSRDPAIRRFDASGALLGVHTLGDVFFNNLLDLDYGPDGHLYAFMIFGIEGSRRVLRFDGTTFLPNFGLNGVFAQGAPLNVGTLVTFGPDGDLYALTLSQVLRYDGATGAYLGVFTVGGPSQLNGVDFAFGPDGDLYVLNGLAQVFRYDGATGAYLDTLPSPGPEWRARSLLFTDQPGPVPGVTEMLSPAGDGTTPVDVAIGLSVMPDGTAHVSSRETDTVFRISPAGAITKLLDAAGGGTDSPLDAPSSTRFSPLASVFVSGGSSDNVFRIDPSGTVTELIDAQGAGPDAPLNAPGPVALRRDGTVFVTGGSPDHVFRIDPGAVPVEVMGSGPENPLHGPGDIVADRRDNVYVASISNDRVFKIAPGGAVTQVMDVSGDGAGHGLRLPSDLVVDSQDHVYVSGYIPNSSGGPFGRILRIAPTGEITWIADLPTVAVDLAIDKQDHLFATWSLRRLPAPAPAIPEVVLLTAAGQLVQIIGSGGAGEGKPLAGPSALAVDDAGRVYVAGASSDNVLRADVARECSNGLDDDGDGLTDFPADPGCIDANDVEDPACDDGLDNDGDGKVDWDGGPDGATPDPQCTQAWRGRESASCGLGFELALLLASWAASRRARRA